MKTEITPLNIIRASIAAAVIVFIICVGLFVNALIVEIKHVGYDTMKDVLLYYSNKDSLAKKESIIGPDDVDFESVMIDKNVKFWTPPLNQFDISQMNLKTLNRDGTLNDDGYVKSLGKFHYKPEPGVWSVFVFDTGYGNGNDSGWGKPPSCKEFIATGEVSGKHTGADIIWRVKGIPACEGYYVRMNRLDRYSDGVNAIMSAMFGVPQKKRDREDASSGRGFDKKIMPDNLSNEFFTGNVGTGYLTTTSDTSPAQWLLYLTEMAEYSQHGFNLTGPITVLVDDKGMVRGVETPHPDNTGPSLYDASVAYRTQGHPLYAVSEIPVPARTEGHRLFFSQTQEDIKEAVKFGADMREAFDDAVMMLPQVISLLKSGDMVDDPKNGRISAEVLRAKNEYLKMKRAAGG